MRNIRPYRILNTDYRIPLNLLPYALHSALRAPRSTLSAACPYSLPLPGMSCFLYSLPLPGTLCFLYSLPLPRGSARRARGSINLPFSHSISSACPTPNPLKGAFGYQLFTTFQHDAKCPHYRILNTDYRIPLNLLTCALCPELCALRPKTHPWPLQGGESEEALCPDPCALSLNHFASFSSSSIRLYIALKVSHGV
jgi:hypothetical protein